MSYIAYLKSLSKSQLLAEITEKINKSNKSELLRKSIRTLPEKDMQFAPDYIADITVEEPKFDSDSDSCLAEASWESREFGDNEAEITMSGFAIARITDDGTVDFAHISAELEVW